MKKSLPSLENVPLCCLELYHAPCCFVPCDRRFARCLLAPPENGVHTPQSLCEELDTRGICIENLSHIREALGTEHWKPYSECVSQLEKASKDLEILCKRHAPASDFEGCVKNMGELQVIFGEDLWNTFSTCAYAAPEGSRADIAACMNEDMATAIQWHIQNSKGGP